MNEPNRLPYIVIAGATATGKSAAAVSLAKRIGGAVISADSMQVYKYMDIGTAKITEEEKLGVPHYLIDEIYPDEPYSAYEFTKRAEHYANKIRGKGKYPIICGGTGFYINALINGITFENLPADEAYRAELYDIARKQGRAVLHGMLKAIDPDSAESIHENNIKRVTRALEYFKQTGTPISAHNREQREKAPQNARIFILTMDRPLLRTQIDIRVDKMFADGLVAEVKGLLEKGYGPELVSMQGIGYKETIRYLQGEYSSEAAIEAVKIATRQYSKRQLTWFKGQVSGTWLDVTGFDGPDEIALRIAEGLDV